MLYAIPIRIICINKCSILCYSLIVNKNVIIVLYLISILYSYISNSTIIVILAIILICINIIYLNNAII